MENRPGQLPDRLNQPLVTAAWTVFLGCALLIQPLVAGWLTVSPQVDAVESTMVCLDDDDDDEDSSASRTQVQKLRRSVRRRSLLSLPTAIALPGSRSSVGPCRAATPCPLALLVASGPSRSAIPLRC